MELQRLKRRSQLFQTLSLLVIGLLSLRRAECRMNPASESFSYESTTCRAHSVSLTDFGGVGDGVTSNTKAFKAAISHLSQYVSDGGGQLYVPQGKWVTGSFNLTSRFTLFLHRDAVILGSQVSLDGFVVLSSENPSGPPVGSELSNWRGELEKDMKEWPLIDPLPSYGRGRDKAGGRYSSLIMGSNLTDVVITGDNGTIDGQGAMWWGSFHKLKYTRGYLIEIMFSDQILISNLRLVNSPSWNIHPVYSSNIIVKGITITAPIKSPNTDGINPDSCTNVRIEDCYIVSGDDCIAIKSGWDEYGIAFGMPTQHVIIRRLTCISPFSATIALGSEMSGGIQDVRAEDIIAINTESAVRIKTAIGRGGYVKNIYARRFNMHTMKYVFWMTGNYGSHADTHYDPNAVPEVHTISYSDMVAENVTIAAKLEGIDKEPFTGICLSNVTIGMAIGKKSKKLPWDCTYVKGMSSFVTPDPCPSLHEEGSDASPCPFPEDRLPIDDVELQQCKYNSYYV